MGQIALHAARGIRMFGFGDGVERDAVSSNGNSRESGSDQSNSGQARGIKVDTLGVVRMNSPDSFDGFVHH
jgi:hypothetical protein